MSISVINIRSAHGRETEQIRFNGNGIKLLDLKNEIVDKKFSESRSSLDFDLKIIDDNTKQGCT